MNTLNDYIPNTTWLFKGKFGFEKFRTNQEEINTILSGHDTLAIMPTGVGNQFAFIAASYFLELQ
jgi:superfamily II DNA helicase RecQ